MAGLSGVCYQPKFGRVLIERVVEEKSKGGVIIPNAKRHASCQGKIIALGETAGWTDTFDSEGEPQVVRVFKIGDEVMFGRHTGAWLDATYTNGEQNDDGKLFICQDADILCVINKGE